MASAAANCTPAQRTFGRNPAGAGGDDSGDGEAGSPPQQTGGGGTEAGAPPTDAVGGSAALSELAIVTPTLPAAGLNVPFDVQLLAEGGSGEGYTFEIEGELAAGLELASDGTIAGTPSEIGEFAITVTVTDSSDNQASRDFVLRMGPHKPSK